MPDLPLPDPAGLWALLVPAVTIALLRIGDVSLNVFRVPFAAIDDSLRLAPAMVGSTTGRI